MPDRVDEINRLYAHRVRRHTDVLVAGRHPIKPVGRGRGPDGCRDARRRLQRAERLAARDDLFLR